MSKGFSFLACVPWQVLSINFLICKWNDNYTIYFIAVLYYNSFEKYLEEYGMGVGWRDGEKRHTTVIE